MNERDVIETLEKGWNLVTDQATQTWDAITEADLHKDRDVIIGVATGVLGGLFFSSALFWVGAGYLTYHFVRRDDHVRTALAVQAEADAKDKADNQGV